MLIKLFLFFFLSNIYIFSFHKSESVKLIINDTIFVQLNKSGRTEMAEIDIIIKNNSNITEILNKQKGIVGIGSVSGEFNPNYCDDFNYNGNFRIFMFDSCNNSLLTSPILSVGDVTYFTNSGKLKHVYLEGVDNHQKIKRSLSRIKRKKDHSIITSLSPNAEIKYKANVYLGDFQLEKNKSYKLLLVYSSSGFPGLSNLCIGSNQLTLIAK